MPSIRGILMSRMARSGGRLLEAVEGGGPVGVRLDAITFGFQRDGDGRQDVAIVVDKGDGGHS